MNLLGLSNNLIKNIFIHVMWIIKPQKAIDLAKKTNDVVAIGYLNEFFSKYVGYGKTNKQIVEINQKIDNNVKTNDKIANALIELRKIRLKLKNLSASKRDQIIKTTKSFGISRGIVRGKILNITSTKQLIPKSCIGIFPTSGVKFTTQFLKCVGIIFLNGGVTSHGAILSREYDIPAVVSPNVNIDNGKDVLINGSTGDIKVIDIDN